MAKHEMVLTGDLQAVCSCGEWQFVGMLPEAKKAIKKIYDSHASIHKRPRSRKSNGKS